jgi:hypothetical protein
MGGLFSRSNPLPKKPIQKSLPLPLLMARAQYISQPLATVLSAMRIQGIENIVVAVKPRETWTPPASSAVGLQPPPRRHTGRIYVLYNADTLLVQDVIYE